eukprot:scaffold86357_cov74-Cyclotella_meneghiniana.AAC.3
MPEIERSRDPFLAGRGKTVRQHSQSLSTKLKKHLHDKYYIPPYRPHNREWELTFASLGWKRRTIQKFWRLFCKINVSRGGGITLEEFLDFFDLDWTPWTERCFRYFDTTGGGDVDFLEFMVSVWNVCTFKIDILSNFTFDMYDLDADGELSIPEIENLIEELYGEKGGRQCLSQITQYAEERGGALSLNAFIAFTGTHQMLLFPMFLIQQKLQRRVFGRRFWQSIDRKSKENSKGGAKNDFNPRHVQILLRTYQTGGAAAVLTHTGDPNKGLRDWYSNQKQNDIKEDIIEDDEYDKSSGIQRWQSIRNNVSTVGSKANPRVKRIQSNGAAIKEHTMARIKSFKRQSKIDNQVVNANAAMGSIPPSSNEIQQHLPSPSAPPRENNAASRPLSANAPPPDVADALHQIRARRSGADKTPSTETSKSNATVSRPRSSSANTPPRDVAAALQSIRTKRQEISPKDPPGEGVGGASRETKVKVDFTMKKRRSRQQRRRTGNDIPPNNVRRRQAGSMFVPAQSEGWLN